jgi:hypothetical protein
LISTARRFICKYTQAYMGARIIGRKYSVKVQRENQSAVRPANPRDCSAYMPTTLEHPRRIHGHAHARDGSTPNGSETYNKNASTSGNIFYRSMCVQM